MKFTVDSLEFKNILKRIIKGYTNKEDRAQVLFTLVDDRTLLVKAVSNTTYFKGLIPIRKLENLGAQTNFSVKGENLKIILDLLPSMSVDVLFDLSENQFNVVAQNRQMKLPVFDDFIPYEDKELKVISEVSASEFLHSLTHLTKIAVTDPRLQSEPVSAIHLNFFDDNISLMATDQVVLTEMKVKHDLKEKAEPVLIRSHQAGLLIQSVLSNDLFQLVETDGMFGYIDKNGITQLVSKANLNEISYTQYKRLIDITSKETSITIDSTAFKDSFTGLSKLSYELPNPTVFSFTVKDNELTLSNTLGDKFTLQVDGDDKDMLLHFTKENFAKINSLLSNKFRMYWNPEVQYQPIRMELLDDEEQVDENVVMVIAPYKLS